MLGFLLRHTSFMYQIFRSPKMRGKDEQTLQNQELFPLEILAQKCSNFTGYLSPIYSLAFLHGTQTNSTDAKASRITFKGAGFNLTEVLISFGPDFPKGTYCCSVTLQPSMASSSQWQTTCWPNEEQSFGPLHHYLFPPS